MRLNVGNSFVGGLQLSSLSGAALGWASTACPGGRSWWAASHHRRRNAVAGDRNEPDADYHRRAVRGVRGVLSAASNLVYVYLPAIPTPPTLGLAIAAGGVGSAIGTLPAARRRRPLRRARRLGPCVGRSRVRGLVCHLWAPRPVIAGSIGWG